MTDFRTAPAMLTAFGQALARFGTPRKPEKNIELAWALGNHITLPIELGYSGGPNSHRGAPLVTIPYVAVT